MSISLSIECDPVEQPAATDPIERRTWCALRIRVGGRTATRILDKALNQERSILYVPAFPLAEWIVSNWWTLLNEPCRTEGLPSPAALAYIPWTRRHCLRCADSALLLPALYLFNDGTGITLEWQADERDTLPNMPGEFVDSGSDRVSRETAAGALSGFIDEIIGRVSDVKDDPRVSDLGASWRAIQAADREELQFCAAAGRMGVDPYEPSEMTDSLAAFIEQSLGDPDRPLARDLTEIAQPDSIADQWTWTTKTAAALNLGAGPASSQIATFASARTPSRDGYQLAGSLRKRAGLNPTQPVTSVEGIAQTMTGVRFRAEEKNHIPGHGVRAVVGWKDDTQACVAGPRSPRADNERFLLARGLYFALFACPTSERLITDAFTWDQQVSRAFAAELLAPREALLARTSGWADRSLIQDLAKDFQASTLLIEKQLANAGVSLSEE